LTTVRVDKESLGRRGIELLLSRERMDDSSVIVPVELVVRESSKVLKSQGRSLR
jgi:DNA-binding LacI/PurR family transcriptional regulator